MFSRFSFSFFDNTVMIYNPEIGIMIQLKVRNKKRRVLMLMQEKSET